MLKMNYVADITLSADGAILADNDVIAATQEVTNFFHEAGGAAEIRSIQLIDDDDQAQDIELIFLNANGSIGAENAAYTTTDAVLDTILGTFLIVIADYSDAINGQTATKRDIGLMLQAAESSRSLWIGAVCRSGTPTYTAAGLKLKIGVKALD